MNENEKPIELVREIMKEYGLIVTYAFEDLVFIEHNSFLLQFGAEKDTLLFSGNSEETEEFVNEAFGKMEKLFHDKGLQLFFRGTYTMSEDENKQLKIDFHE